jgi:hypothetical protein
VKREWQEYGLGIRTLRSLRRGAYRFFSPQWPHRKEFVAARFTSQRRKSQQSPEEGYRARHEFRRNALQFEVAADPAMRINNVA